MQINDGLPNLGNPGGLGQISQHTCVIHIICALRWLISLSKGVGLNVWHYRELYKKK